MELKENVPIVVQQKHKRVQRGCGVSLCLFKSKTCLPKVSCKGCIRRKFLLWYLIKTIVTDIVVHVVSHYVPEYVLSDLYLFNNCYKNCNYVYNYHLLSREAWIRHQVLFLWPKDLKLLKWLNEYILVRYVYRFKYRQLLNNTFEDLAKRIQTKLNVQFKMKNCYYV